MPSRVEPHERDREAGPQLVLELLEDVARGDHEDLVAPAAADQLGQDHPDLEGLAEPDRVGDQEAGPEAGRAPCAPRGAGTRGGSGADACETARSAVRRRDRRLAQHRFEPQSACAGNPANRPAQPSPVPGPEPRCVEAACRRSRTWSRTSSTRADGLTITPSAPRAQRPYKPLLVADDHDGAGRDVEIGTCLLENLGCSRVTFDHDS